MMTRQVFKSLLFLIFVFHITQVHCLYDIDKFSIQASSYTLSATTSYSLIFNVIDGIPAGLELQIILPEDYTLDKSTKTLTQKGYPTSTYIEGFTSDPDYIISIRLDSLIAANTNMNLTISPMKNQNHNRYYKPITFIISNWVAGTEVKHVVDPYFRLKGWSTTPVFTVTSGSVQAGAMTSYNLDLTTTLPGFNNSRFIYRFPDGFRLENARCTFDTSVLLDSTCEIDSSSQEVILKIFQDIPAGKLNLVLDNVGNPTTISMTKDYIFEFTSLDFESQVMETNNFTFTDFACEEDCEFCSASECLGCFEEFYLYEGSCYSQCPLPSYLDSDKDECSRECISGCSECFGSKTNCTVCDESLVFYNFSCLTNCPENYTATEAGICELSPIVIVKTEESKAKKSLNKLNFTNTPIIAIYLAACFTFWFLSGMCSRGSLNGAALLVVLSLLEPIIYVYLLAMTILLQDYYPLCLFSFLTTTKITLQLLFSTVDLYSSDPNETTQTLGVRELRRLCFLRIFEYCYNFKLCYLRECKLFGLKSLTLTRFAQRKLYVNTMTVLRADSVLEIFAIFGYFGYFLLYFLFKIPLRSVYIEGGCFILVHAILTGYKLSRMKKFLSRFVTPLNERIEVGQVVPAALISSRSNHIDQSIQMPNSTTTDDTSMMQRFHQTGDTSRIDIEKAVSTNSPSPSLFEINTARSQKKNIFSLNLAAIEEYQTENGQEEDACDDSIPTFNKDDKSDDDPTNKGWSEMDSAIFGIPNMNKEEDLVVSKDTNSERCIRSSEGFRKSPMSFGKKLRMLSDSFAKSLANLASPEKKNKPIQTQEIQSFGAINMKKGLEMSVLDSQGSFSGNKYIQRSSGMLRMKDKDKRPESEENKNMPMPRNPKWWAIKTNVKSSAKLGSQHAKTIEEELREAYQPNVKKLVFKKTMSANNLLQFPGKLVLKDLRVEKLKNEKPQDHDIVKIE